MKRFVLVVLGGVVLGCGSSNGQGRGSPQLRLGVGNFVEELLDCAVYFQIGNEGVAQRHDGNTLESQRTIKQYRKAAEKALEYARVAAKEIGMSTAALNAKAKLSADEQMRLIDNSMVNFSVLLVKFRQSCQALMEAPNARMMTLIEKELRRPKKR